MIDQDRGTPITDGGADSPTDGDDSSGYVHRPSGEPPDPSGDRSFGWRGWLLVGTLVLAFLVVPGLLLVVPHAGSAIAALGLTRRDAYLVLPLVPAILLGVVAVWSAVRSRSG